MRRIVVVVGMASVLLAADASAQRRTDFSLGGGLSLRALERTPVSSVGDIGLSAQFGVLGGRADARVRPQGILGAQVYGGAAAIPGCVPGGNCRSYYNLTMAANASFGVSVRAFDAMPRLRWLAAAGGYWAGTDNASGSEADGARSLFAAGVNGGLALAGPGRLELEVRVHAPIGMDEVRLFATPTLSVRW